MKRSEQDILNVIDEKTKEVEIPESLMPENIEKKLKELENQEEAQGQKEDIDRMPSDGKKRNKRNKIIAKRCFGSLVAACVVLALGVFVFSRVLPGNQNAEETAVEEAATETNAAEIKSALPTATSYEEIYSYIEEVYAQNETGSTIFDSFMRGTEEEIAVEESADMAIGANTKAKELSSAASEDYSTTNVRQDGVDEADTLKTDGRYLYVLKDDNSGVAIVDTKNGLKEVNVVEVEENDTVSEFYMLPKEKKLLLIVSRYEEMEEGTDVAVTDDVVSKMMYMPIATSTTVITYDVSDVKNPEKEGEVTQSGNYTSSRLVGNYVYLFSHYSVGNAVAKEEARTYIPAVNGNLLEVEDIYMPELKKARSYEIITSIDIQNPTKEKDSKAIFTEGGEIYVSSKNIYYYETRWDEEETTAIRKISYNDKGELSAVAKCEIKGYINDSFSIDEHEGFLRIVVTTGDTNSVYVLDEALEMTGKIEGLAEEERVYSARFMGETGYFVTFRETDPLFTMDLSNPKDPKIIGKLKIPGFSEYLHFYGEDKLLGIGMGVDEETQITEGVKLTMFDISDKTDVKEENTYLMENVYSADVTFDYKAALIDVEKNMIGFAAYPEGAQKYYLFSYDEEKGFICNMEEELNGNASKMSRAVYIENTLYVVQGNVIESYNLKTYLKEDDLIL